MMSTMRAKTINEIVDDILKPKSKEDIISSKKFTDIIIANDGYSGDKYFGYIKSFDETTNTVIVEFVYNNQYKLLSEPIEKTLTIRNLQDSNWYDRLVRKKNGYIKRVSNMEQMIADLKNRSLN